MPPGRGKGMPPGKGGMPPCALEGKGGKGMPRPGVGGAVGWKGGGGIG